MNPDLDKRAERGVAVIKNFNKNANSIFSVFLAVALLFSLFPMNLNAQVEISADPGDGGDTYVYAVEIEFGSFAFYYDWGTWNVNTFSYDADSSSISPAADTVPGKAGWYSFDGTNNRIRVENYNVSTSGKMVAIDIQYTDVGEDFDHFPLDPGCVNVDFYDTPEFTNQLNTSGSNSYRFTMQNNTSASIYLSFSGKPVLPSGEPYMSMASRPIGYITIGVGVIDPVTPEPSI